MLNAKDKFREGYIMLLRPFEFHELKNPLQKLTILWAYSEQPILKNVLTEKARDEAWLIENQSGLPFFSKEHKEEIIESQLETLLLKKESFEQLYEGDIVQYYLMA